MKTWSAVQYNAIAPINSYWFRQAWPVTHTHSRKKEGKPAKQKKTNWKTSKEKSILAPTRRCGRHQRRNPSCWFISALIGINYNNYYYYRFGSASTKYFELSDSATWWANGATYPDAYYVQPNNSSLHVRWLRLLQCFSWATKTGIPGLRDKNGWSLEKSRKQNPRATMRLSWNQAYPLFRDKDPNTPVHKYVDFNHMC